MENRCCESASFYPDGNNLLGTVLTMFGFCDEKKIIWVLRVYLLYLYLLKIEVLCEKTGKYTFIHKNRQKDSRSS
jgi:hypothetical protein